MENGMKYAHILQPQKLYIVLKPLNVRLHSVPRAHKEQPRAGIEISFVIGIGLNNILLFLVRGNPAEKQQVGISIGFVFPDQLLVRAFLIIIKRNKDRAHIDWAAVPHIPQFLPVELGNGNHIFHLVPEKTDALITGPAERFSDG